jgi:hypothetical protein
MTLPDRGRARILPRMIRTARRAAIAGEPIVIYQSSDLEGSTFALSLETEKALEAHFGGKLRMAPRIFIAHAKPSAAARLHGRLATKLLSLLTGLDEAQLADLGPIGFIDPVTERWIAPPPARTNARRRPPASGRDTARTTRPSLAHPRGATRSAAKENRMSPARLR